jgi:hypothetical protein
MLQMGKYFILFIYFYFIISQNIAICLKTFSDSIDRRCLWNAGDTSSDISPIKVQSQVIDHGLWGFYRVLVKI